MHKHVLGPVMLAIAIVAPPLATTAQSNELVYCSSGAVGAQGCSYSTLAQCQASVSGTGAYCSRNPHYAPATRAFAHERRPRR